MADDLVVAIQSIQDAVTKQADTVRSLKAEVKEGKREKVRGNVPRALRVTTSATSK